MLKNLLQQVLHRRPPSAAAVNHPAGRRASEADALCEQAELERKRGNAEAAATLYRSALLLDPSHRESWMSLGVMSYREGSLALAHQHFRCVLALDPNDAEALNELGLVELAYGNRTDARSTFEQLLDRHPDHHEAWNNLGLALAGQGQLEEACRAFRRALAIKPDHLVACANLGLACRDLNRPQEARSAFEAARRIDPASAGVRVGLALALQDLGNLSQARTELERALELAPDAPDVLAAFGDLMLRLGLPEEARRTLQRALAIAPDDAEARLAHAHLLLAEGDYARGWEQYEARLEGRASPKRSYPLPHWRSTKPPAGARILVYGEQGLGEQVMFASMLDELAAVAQVTLDCEPRLRTLLARSFPRLKVRGADERGIERGQFDACIPIGSLARYYRRSEREFPMHSGYLRADSERREKWRRRLSGPRGALKVGLAWRGGLASTGRELRSVAVDALGALARQPGVQWVNLQHDASDPEIAAFRQFAPLLHDAAALSDLEETAALIHVLDLVIAPCSTTVHLAGALGRQVWVLTPFAPAWRYRLQGQGMPWYPSARLYRQSAPGEWGRVLDSVRDSLDALCGAGAGG